jgi:TolA-binding protein
MKSTERHRLKDNELVGLAVRLREYTTSAGQQTLLIAGGVLIVAAAAGAVYFWRGSVDGRAHALLAEALSVQEARVGPPPAPGTPATGLSFPTERERLQAALTKFKLAADSYPSNAAGVFARYQEAATRLELGFPDEAAKSYQLVIDRAGSSSLYGQMARLGMAEAQARSGQHEQAINTFKELAQQKDGPFPVDGVLMQLGRTYLDAGKPTDAEQTFNRLVEEFPESPFTSDARRELDALKKT